MSTRIIYLEFSRKIILKAFRRYNRWTHKDGLQVRREESRQWRKLVYTRHQVAQVRLQYRALNPLQVSHFPIHAWILS